MNYHLIDGLIMLLCILSVFGLSLIFDFCLDLIMDWKIEKERKNKNGKR